MKILERLTSAVLIIGIMSSVMAQEQIISQKETVENRSGPGNISDSSTGITGIKVPVLLEFDQYFENQMERKCEKNRGLSAYNDFNHKDIPLKFANCVDSLVNITQFKSEMAAARPQREQNLVVQNYCRRVPIFENCLRNVTDFIEPCLDPEERDSVNILHDVTSSLLRFSCDHWDVVEEFIVAGGAECLSSNYRAIQECSRQIFPFPDREPVTIPGLGDLPKLSPDIAGCTNVEEYQRCSVKVLKKCDSPIPSVVVDDLFNFVKRETSCATLLNPLALNSHAKRSTLSQTIPIKNRERRTPKFGTGLNNTGLKTGLKSFFSSKGWRSDAPHASSASAVVIALAIIVAMTTSSRFA